MKYYILTLLKDLPGIKAGQKIYVNDKNLKENSCPYFINNSYEDNERNFEIFKYRDNKEWVKTEIDLSKTLPIQCPFCKKENLFPYFSDKFEREYSCDVTKTYQKVGLECPFCEKKIITHRVCVDKKVNW